MTNQHTHPPKPPKRTTDAKAHHGTEMLRIKVAPAWVRLVRSATTENRRESVWLDVRVEDLIELADEAKKRGWEPG